MLLITLSMSAKAMAHQKPSTVNPGVTEDEIRITTALITNKNKPKVSRLKGKVSKMSKGLMVKLIRMMTMTSTIAESQLLT